MSNEGLPLLFYCILPERIILNNFGRCRNLIPLYFLSMEADILIRSLLIPDRDLSLPVLVSYTLIPILDMLRD